MTDTPETPAPVADRMAAARAARADAAEATKAEAPTPPVAADRNEVAEDLPAGPTILERAAANEEERRLEKIAKLRAAKLNGSDPVAEPVVTVRVLKKGHGLISMGDHVGGLGELTYDFGETPGFPQSIAEALEDKGLVEIQ